ncbi:uncharacterized protein LOC100185483 isoform X1 [Ciona intestinalis]
MDKVDTTLMGSAIGSTIALILIASYLFICSLSRANHWIHLIRKGNSSKKATTAATNVIETRSLNSGKTNSSRAHVILYTICCFLISVIVLRAFLYVVLMILGTKAGELACDLILETATLLSGLGLVFVYAFVWRCQRYFYFLKEFHRFYTKPIRMISWCIAFIMTITAMTRLMLYMMGWKYGAQSSPSAYGCRMLAFNENGTYVSYMERNLLLMYNTVVGSVISVLGFGLYFNLWFRSNRTELTGASGIAVSCLLRNQLLRSTVCSLFMLLSAVIPEILLWFVIPGNLPAVLTYVVEDASFIVQVISMFCCLGDWKTAFFPDVIQNLVCCVMCRRRGNINMQNAADHSADESGRTYVLEEITH